MLLDLIYPQVCGICGKIGYKGLCRKCEIYLKHQIGLSIDKYEDDIQKYFEEHIYFFKYDGMIRRRLLNYKFRYKSYLYKTFVKIIVNDKKNCQYLDSYDIIIPVPIHKERKKQRGYNQTELIAKNLEKYIKNIKYEDKILCKTKNIMPQSILTKQERMENVKNVYEIKNSEKIKQKNILIFDDIYTTGSTVNEISKILKQNGANRIGILTIAKD